MKLVGYKKILFFMFVSLCMWLPTSCGNYEKVPTMDVEFRNIAFTGPEWHTPKHGEVLVGNTIMISLGKVLSISNHSNCSYTASVSNQHQVLQVNPTLWSLKKIRRR